MRNRNRHTTDTRAGLVGLGNEDRAALQRSAVQTSLPAGTVLVNEGAWGKEAFFVIEGEVVVRRDGNDIATVGAGEFVGEMSTLDGEARSATVVCLTECQLYVMSVPDLRRVLDEAPGLRQRLERSLSARLRHATTGGADR